MSPASILVTETWERLCTSPGFTHPGFTCDVSSDGKIIMSPTFNYHGWFQARISVLLAQLAPQGQPFVELAVLTEAGLFEVDVAWTTRFRELRTQKYASPAPEICIEVESESNTEAEFETKRKSLFQAGCQEVWIVNRMGKVSFYLPAGPASASALIPDFPVMVDA